MKTSGNAQRTFDIGAEFTLAKVINMKVSNRFSVSGIWLI